MTVCDWKGCDSGRSPGLRTSGRQRTERGFVIQITVTALLDEAVIREAWELAQSFGVETPYLSFRRECAEEHARAMRRSGCGVSYLTSVALDLPEAA